MWNELAVLYSSTPIFEEVTEQPSPEEEEYPLDSTPPAEEAAAVSGQENEEQIPSAASQHIPEPADPGLVPAAPDSEMETSQYSDEKESPSKQNS
jgi:hypothetical protein